MRKSVRVALDEEVCEMHRLTGLSSSAGLQSSGCSFPTGMGGGWGATEGRPRTGVGCTPRLGWAELLTTAHCRDSRGLRLGETDKREITGKSSNSAP